MYSTQYTVQNFIVMYACGKSFESNFKSLITH